MKARFVTVLLSGTLCLQSMAWTPADNTIKTRWSDSVTPENVWKSYPRPQLKRELWQNLNGLWQFTVTDSVVSRDNVTYDGEILVPFAVESSLSGVKKSIRPEDRLWYRREFSVTDEMRGKNLILHFGAVDYSCDLWVNGKYVGSHVGGNNSFSFDITKFVSGKKSQILEVKVADPTDTESITRGKQQLDQKGIWYTPVSGIWKTVWIEAVNSRYIRKVHPVTDIHEGTVSFITDVQSKGNETLRVEVIEEGKVVASSESNVSDVPVIHMPEFRLWTPDTPVLYDVRLTLLSGGKILDEVDSYFAFRSIGITKDEAGYNRFTLNDSIVFQYGTLDQGWWPDGLLTPPCEEAMLWDMQQLKNMGFNTIRKHIKVEPELYYYFADSLGLMIWQDMVSGFATQRKQQEHVAASSKDDWNAPENHTLQWQSELFGMIDQLRFYPSITTWVVFNEGWGQHNTAEIVKKVEAYDSSRIIDGVSGWADRGVGDLYDVHNYPVSSMILPELNGDRISVLGEFGGYGLPLDGHLWNPEMRNWGYRNADGGVNLVESYARVVYDLEALVAQGLSGAIYTQTTDVEGEVNGLITYDREIIKIPSGLMHMLHGRLYSQSGKEAVTLIEDGQNGTFHERCIERDGESSMLALPAVLSGKGKVTSKCVFDCEEKYTNLSLWIAMPGKVNVWLNGKLVFEQESRLTRHYNQYNISDYASFLKVGKNELVIQLDSSNAKDFRFDYGLRAYNQ